MSDTSKIYKKNQQKNVTKLKVEYYDTHSMIHCFLGRIVLVQAIPLIATHISVVWSVIMFVHSA